MSESLCVDLASFALTRSIDPVFVSADEPRSECYVVYPPSTPCGRATWAVEYLDDDRWCEFTQVPSDHRDSIAELLDDADRGFWIPRTMWRVRLIDWEVAQSELQHLLRAMRTMAGTGCGVPAAVLAPWLAYEVAAVRLLALSLLAEAAPVAAPCGPARFAEFSGAEPDRVP